MGLAQANIWTGQTASGYSKSIISTEQSSSRAELSIRELMTIVAKYGWYWSADWQAWEKEADDDWQLGRYEAFESMDDFIESLGTH